MINHEGKKEDLPIYAFSDWPILGHHYSVMATGRLWAERVKNIANQNFGKRNRWVIYPFLVILFCRIAENLLTVF